MSPFTPGLLWDHLTTGVIALDGDGVVRAVNNAAERLLGRGRNHLLGVPLAALLPGHPVALDLIHRARNLAMPCRVRSAQINPAPGLLLSVSLTAVPLENGEGEQVGALLQLEEMGALERIEEGQRLHDTLDSLETLAMTVAHEVKNPLAGIRGVAQLLEMEGGSSSVATCTALICTEVDRISRLLDELLGLAEGHSQSDDPVNVHEVLDHVLRLCPPGPARIERDYDPSLPAIRGDRDRLVQLFLNLVRNALDAAGATGTLSLHTRVSTQVRFEQGRRQRHILVEVRDDGPGIAESVRARMFLPFVTSKPKGAGNGLGLAIVQKIVHDHGGMVEVARQGEQTIFRILLPMSRP
ncbi:MAG: PAS domain-containing protein [Magnetococcales bacterium]|nr:PAS domain-containing protein [Magnetococcales bacterium]